MSFSHKQGTLDGLCGVYAIVNSIAYTHQSDIRSSKIFSKIIRKISKKSIVDGIKYFTIGKLLNKLSDKEKISFYHYTTNDKDSLTEIIRKKRYCAIVALRSKSIDHWTVITNIDSNNKVVLLDSDNLRSFSWNTVRIINNDKELTFRDSKYKILKSEIFIIERKK